MNSGIRKVKRGRKEFGRAFQLDLNTGTIILFDCMTRNISDSSSERHWPKSCHSEINGNVPDVFTGNRVWPKPDILEVCSPANSAAYYSRREWCMLTGCMSAVVPPPEPW